jgi:TonB family protein
MYVLNRNRQSSRIFILGIFIAVASIHIAILTSMDGYLSNKGTKSETARLLESFLIEAYEPAAISSLNSSQTTATSISISISKSIATQVEALSTPLASVGQQNDFPTLPSDKQNTNIPSTNNQTNKSQDALTLPITHAKHLHNPPPPYPKQSRRRGEQGKVVIAVEIDIEGTSSQAVVHQSSGSHRLDRAALETVLKWRFIPGKKGTENQKMWVNIPINFVLE